MLYFAQKAKITQNIQKIQNRLLRLAGATSAAVRRRQQMNTKNTHIHAHTWKRNVIGKFMFVE